MNQIKIKSSNIKEIQRDSSSKGSKRRPLQQPSLLQSKHIGSPQWPPASSASLSRSVCCPSTAAKRGPCTDRTRVVLGGKLAGAETKVNRKMTSSVLKNYVQSHHAKAHALRGTVYFPTSQYFAPSSSEALSCSTSGSLVFASLDPRHGWACSVD